MNVLDRRLLAPPLLFVILLASVGCGRSDDWNVLLVTFDTTRADHLGCYGNDQIKTPHVDGLAAEGTRFAHAYTSVPITTPSHSSILTGKYPIGHGVRDNGLFILSGNQVTLAEALKERGWRTAASIGAFPLIAKFGLNQGFDLYDDTLNEKVENFLGERVLPKTGLYFDERKAGRVNEALLPWLEEHRNKKFFAWAHYYDPHQPFQPPAPYNQLYAGRPYEGEIAYADESFGRLLGRLRELDIYDRTIIILTADHGEGLGEHNELTHSVQIYNTTLHVPLIIKVPGQPAGLTVTEPVGTIDILPTVLDFLGIEVPAGVQGQSLASHLRGEEDKEPTQRTLYAETLSPRLGFGWGELRALIQHDYKYIYGPSPELYAMDDPRELRELSGAQPDLASDMQRQLARFLRENAADDLAGAVDMDDETRRKLEALGYISGNAGEDEEIVEELRQGGIPPQDRVADVSEMSAAKQLLFAKQALAAQDIIETLLARQPDNPTYLEMLAMALFQQGRFADGAETVERLRRLDRPSALTGKLLLQIGSVHFDRGEHNEAEAALTDSLRLEPSAAGHYLLANIYAARGLTDRKQAALESALEIDPSYPFAQVDLAVLYARAGDREQAEAQFEKLIADYPYFAKAFFNYGVFLLAGNDRDGAVTRMQRTVEVDPTYWPAYLALVELHLDLGQLDEARRHAKTLHERASQTPQAQRAQQLIEEAS